MEVITLNGKEVKVRINTGDTLKSGEMTNREADAAKMINIKIEREGENPKLITIPKSEGETEIANKLNEIEKEYQK